MSFFNVIRWITWKDLISEFRNRENFSSMLFFALIVVLIFSFSFSMDQTSGREQIPGIIWVAFTFTGMIGLGKSFAAELHNDCLDSLQFSPAQKGAVFIGKFLANLLFLLFVELLLFPMFVLLFNLEVLEKLPTILVIFLGGSVGLSAVGTLFSAMTVQIRAREVMLPILLLPLAVPLIIGGVEATAGVLRGDPFLLYAHWIRLLFAFDVIFLVVSFWAFEWILDT